MTVTNQSTFSNVERLILDATITVGTEASDIINVAIQLTDRLNINEMSERASIGFYLATDANGDTPASTAPTGGIAIGTDGAMIEWTANLSGMLTSESDGDIDINLTDTGTPTFYLILVMPDGKLIASGAITFA